MALVLNWQRKLGYQKDPFDTNIPTPVKKYIIGTEHLQERLNLFLIKEEQFGTISGEKGCGKTMLLRWMDEELAPQRSHMQQYMDAKVMHAPDTIVSTLLKNRLSLLEKGLRKFMKGKKDPRQQLLQHLAKEKKTVLLVDNAGYLNDAGIALFAEIKEKTRTHIIFADTAERLKRLGLGDAKLHDTLKLALPTYTGQHCHDILQRRIEGAGSSETYPFSEQEVQRLAKHADNNPTKLLQGARERAIELSLKTVSAPPTRAEPERKGGFLSIKIEKKPSVVIETPEILDVPESIIAEKAAEQERAKANNAEDADLLANVISATENVAQDTQKKESSVRGEKGNDQIIAQLAKEFEKNTSSQKKPVAKRSPVKKKTKKK